MGLNTHGSLNKEKGTTPEISLPRKTSEERFNNLLQLIIGSK